MVRIKDIQVSKRERLTYMKVVLKKEESKVIWSKQLKKKPIIPGSSSVFHKYGSGSDSIRNGTR